MGIPSLHNIIPQPHYAAYLRETTEFVRDFKKALPAEELAKYEAFKSMPDNPADAVKQAGSRRNAAQAVLKAIIQAKNEGKMTKAFGGVTTGLGYNFFDLRAPVYLQYPVNVPFRNALPRVGRVNDGYGTMAHWKATRNVGSVYAGVPEGQRNQIVEPDENDYAAGYKEIGVERGVSFTAQFAGEGYADNLADEHLRGLHELWLQEEGLILLGNSGTGTGNNGFKLNVPPTPVATLVAGTGITDATKITAYVVVLTGLGNPQNAQYGYQPAPTVAAGLVPSFVRTSQAGETATINGGMSKVSLVSNSVTTTGSTHQVKFTFAASDLPIKGAFGYAWFISSNASPTTANAYLTAITQFPTYTLTADPPTSGQTAAATGLNVDNSFNVTDIDGLLSYAASTPGAYYKDLQGGSLTSEKNGRVTEIEATLLYIFQQYQAGVDEIWGSADAVVALDQAIRYSGTLASAYRFDYSRDQQGNLLGGFVVSAYQSRYAVANPTGANAIPIRIHPMIPAGTLFFHIKTNPYPHSRTPFVAGMLVQREYYSIEWPITSRVWTFGTYVHETIQHNYPWMSAVVTGIGPFVGS